MEIKCYKISLKIGLERGSKLPHFFFTHEYLFQDSKMRNNYKETPSWNLYRDATRKWKLGKEQEKQKANEKKKSLEDRLEKNGTN